MIMTYQSTKPDYHSEDAVSRKGWFQDVIQIFQKLISPTNNSVGCLSLRILTMLSAWHYLS